MSIPSHDDSLLPEDGSSAGTQILPLFPLPDLILFPGQMVPLHIFEPRYRQMARDALDSERRIGMVVARPDQLDAMQQSPNDSRSKTT